MRRVPVRRDTMQKHPFNLGTFTIAPERRKQGKINLVVQCKSQSVGQWFIVSDLVIHSYLISCVFVFLHLCIWQSKISFLMSLDYLLFKNISICRVFLTLSNMLYLCIVYLYLCICVFDNPWLFENIAHVGYFRHVITVYFCICVFVFVYLCIWQSRISFLMSLDPWLFKNIAL